MPKIIFMGTPEFAVPALESIHNKFGVEAVVTVPDKPKGRGRKLSGSAVKEKAVELGLPIFQPDSLNDESFTEQIKSIEPDIICVIAFRILPESIFSIPRIASFNIHGSILPKYRGAAPINRAIMNGEKTSGLTSFILQKKVDTGNILLNKEITIGENMTAGELHDELMPLAAELSLETIELLVNDNYDPKPQDDSKESPAPKIFRDDCKINFKQEQGKVHDHIRGLSPYPASWTIFNDQEIKILRTEKTTSHFLNPGDYKIDNEFLFGTNSGDIKILEIKPQGKRTQNVEDFIRGYRGNKSGSFS